MFHSSFFRTLALIAFGFGLSACNQGAQAQANTIPELQDLQTLAQKAEAKNLPIMITVGADWCDFCYVLKKNVLDPMMLGGDYEGKKLYMRYLSLEDDTPIPGIAGQKIIKREWAEKHKADLTPTVIFIDSYGREVADKIVGISALELYMGLIHQRLNQAYKNLGNPMRVDTLPTP